MTQVLQRFCFNHGKSLLEAVASVSNIQREDMGQEASRAHRADTDCCDKVFVLGIWGVEAGSQLPRCDSAAGSGLCVRNGTALKQISRAPAAVLDKVRPGVLEALLAQVKAGSAEVALTGVNQ